MEGGTSNSKGVSYDEQIVAALARKCQVDISTMKRYFLEARALARLSSASGQSEDLKSELSTASTAGKDGMLRFRIENYDGEVTYIEMSPLEATIDFLKKQIVMEFELGLDSINCYDGQVGTFKLQYIDNGEAIMLRTDHAMARCIKVMKDGQATVRVKNIE